MNLSEWKALLNDVGCYEAISKLLERIERSEINGYITVCKKEALSLAESFDKGNLKGKLAGVPVAVKDNITTKGIRTTCASKMLENYVPVFDAHVVERLKAEGAIIIGKTNMDEFGMGTTTETSYFGVVKNPYDLNRVAGGSSGGSAAVLAANEAVLALGSDTGGSIRCPASFCGVYGLKPTYGLVSRYGLIPYANSLEQIGPMANSIEDIATLLEVIAGKDERDSTNSGKSFVFREEKVERIGLIKNMTAEEEVMDKFYECMNNFDYEEVELPSLKYALASYYVIAMSEASSNLARYDGV
ncbi:MAG: amidase family protein, partial [Archaeoglobaceae archaeon]